MSTSATPATASLSIAAKRRRVRLPWTCILGLVVLVVWCVASILAGVFLPADMGDMGNEDVFAQISRLHVLGTDYLGRDVLARVLQGAGYTVGVALVATLLASGSGTLLALFAATREGWVDAALSRLLDILISIPSKMFALMMVAAFGASVPLLIVTATIVYLPGAFRIARALAMNVAAMDYVTVARTRGESTFWIMRREILPNIAGPMLADLGLRFVYVVLLLAGLSFLGLGVQPPHADWGSLVRENIGGLATGSSAVIAPAFAIASLTIAVNLVIDGLPGRSNRRGGER